MKALVVILLVLAGIDLAFDRGAVLIGIWAAIEELGATIHRGIWASA